MSEAQKKIYSRGFYGCIKIKWINIVPNYHFLENKE